jgi:hypothetical protein
MVGVRRREFIALFGGAAASWPTFIDAQARLPRVGILWHGADEKDEVFNTDVGKSLPKCSLRLC